MFSFILLFILLIVLIALVLFLWIRERRYLKKKTSEAMSEEVWEEVVKEREDALEKRRKFREAMESAKKKPDFPVT